jgi:ubiquitin-protein ligase
MTDNSTDPFSYTNPLPISGLGPYDASYNNLPYLNFGPTGVTADYSFLHGNSGISDEILQQSYQNDSFADIKVDIPAPVKSVVITKSTITRLLHDVKQIIKNPLSDNGIYYIHDDEDLLKGYALIIGPEDTPYFGGNYLFEFTYPADYPHSPPSIKYCTNGDNIRFNPNLYTGGKVCISIINTWKGEQWTSCQTISTVLLTLCMLLCKDPLLNEPGITQTHKDFNNYTKIIEYKNIEIAILKMATKNVGVYSPKFDCFYSIMVEHFLKNSAKINKYLEEKKKTQPTPLHIITNLYSMNVMLDYKKLHATYIEVLKNIQ